MGLWWTQDSLLFLLRIPMGHSPRLVERYNTHHESDKKCNYRDRGRIQQRNQLGLREVVQHRVSECTQCGSQSVQCSMGVHDARLLPTNDVSNDSSKSRRHEPRDNPQRGSQPPLRCGFDSDDTKGRQPQGICESGDMTINAIS